MSELCPAGVYFIYVLKYIGIKLFTLSPNFILMFVEYFFFLDIVYLFLPLFLAQLFVRSLSFFIKFLLDDQMLGIC